MKTILIVDDEVALVETLRDFLEGSGYRVETATDGKEGLESMKRQRPDLVITDLMMPIMDGARMLSVMRDDRDLAPIPVILMSAVRRQFAIPSPDQFPTFSAFLRKPFTLRALTDCIVASIGPGETSNDR
jgi:two-component system, OmpR family, response regulator VicR